MAELPPRHHRNPVSQNPRLEVGAFLGAIGYWRGQQLLTGILNYTLNVQHLNPVGKFLLQNTGDLADTYLWAAITDIVVASALPSSSNTLRRLTATGVSLGILALAEIPTLNHLFPIGTPDYLDIPFGLLGTAAFLGVKLLADKTGRQVR